MLLVLIQIVVREGTPSPPQNPILIQGLFLLTIKIKVSYHLFIFVVIYIYTIVVIFPFYYLPFFCYKKKFYFDMVGLVAWWLSSYFHISFFLFLDPVGSSHFKTLSIATVKKRWNSSATKPARSKLNSWKSVGWRKR